jgi:hypothetical protein
MTKEDYIKKMNCEKERVTRLVISNIKRLIEMRNDVVPIVEEYVLNKHEKKYFYKKALDELEKEYPFLEFTYSSDLISMITKIEWGLK